MCEDTNCWNCPYSSECDKKNTKELENENTNNKTNR